MGNLKQAEYQKQKTEECFAKIAELITSGKLPKAMADSFAFERHMSNYSPTNQMLVIINTPNTVVDAMGYRQWEKLGRKVKKGEVAIRILAPSEIKIPKFHIDAATDERVQLTDNDGNPIYDKVLRFKTVPVFEFHQTEPMPLFQGEVWTPPKYEPDPELLPDVVEVMRGMGIAVSYEATPRKGRLGSCSNDTKAVKLHTQDIGTALHEMAHAIDGRINGQLKSGQHSDQECVAEIASAVLSILLYGVDITEDAAAYVAHYEPRDKGIMQFINRTYKVVNAICDLVAHYRDKKSMEGWELILGAKKQPLAAKEVDTPTPAMVG